MVPGNTYPCDRALGKLGGVGGGQAAVPTQWTGGRRFLGSELPGVIGTPSPAG